MAVLITGADGFVGRHLVPELERRGVRARLPARRDIGPLTQWDDALEGIEVVVHLAAMAHERAAAAQNANDYQALRHVNGLGSERLAQAAARAGVRHFVFVSTIGVHGEETRGQPFSEDSPLAPVSLYARSKLEAEQLLGAVSRDTGLALSVLRPTLVYGPGNPGNFLRLLRWIDSGWPLPLASVDNRRSLTHVDNLVSAIVASVSQPSSAGTFVVCDQEPISTPKLVVEIARALDRPPRLFALPPASVRFAATCLGMGDVARRVLGSLEASPVRIQRLLDWRAPVDTPEGLRQTARWYRLQHPLP